MTQIPTTIVKNENAVPIIQYPINVDSFKNNEQDKSYIEAKAADNAFYLYRQGQDMIPRIGWTECNQQDNQNCASETILESWAVFGLG